MIVAALFAAAPAAHAQCDGCNGGGWGWGYDMGCLYNSLDYNVPYFAAHPPVYYSYPVPRTYGYSPFAYPPYVMTPEVEMGAETAGRDHQSLRAEHAARRRRKRRSIGRCHAEDESPAASRW